MDKRPFIIFGVAAIILLSIFLLFRKKGPNYNWKETYKETSKEPYGTYVIYEMLKDYFPNQVLKPITKSVTEELQIDTGAVANYLFIGEGQFLDSMDVVTLLDFVESGNNAFISSKTIPYDLMFHIYYEECDNYIWNDYDYITDSLATLNFGHDDLYKENGFAYQFLEYNEPKKYRWNYIDTAYFCDEYYSLIPLGTFDGEYVNFAKKRYGLGAFYLHTNPVVFSNVQLLDEKGMDYASKALSHLEKGTIYWDQYSRVQEVIARRRNERSGQNSNRELSEGPLKYILSQPSLAWAWYTFLGLGLTYMFFRSKRKQRIIPVLEKNKNTSLDFISTISTLYFIQNDHKKLCVQKMKLFLTYIRNRYNVSTHELDEVFVNRIAAKSEISKKVINTILLYYKNIESSQFVSEQTLIEFHLAVDKFYKNCK